MLELLLFIVIVLIVAAILSYAMTLVPGMPPFGPALVWVIAALLILFRALPALGYHTG